MDRSKLPVNSPKVNESGRALFAQMVQEGKIIGFFSEITEEHQIDSILYKDAEAREEHKTLFAQIPNTWVDPNGQTPDDFNPCISSELREATEDDIDIMLFP